MRIAYFSPFPPKQTGIALYSEELVSELRKLVSVDCYDFNNDHANDPSTGFGDFAPSGRISALHACDAVLYHLGNNPHFHLDILETLRLWPGIVVLHDIVLYYLFAGLGNAGLVKHLWMVEGRNGTDLLTELLDTSLDRDILRYPHPERHPLTSAVFPYATRIIVHNKSARDRIIKMGYTGAIDVIPHLVFPSADTGLSSEKIGQLRCQHGISSDEVVVGCLGFIGPTKRIAQVCQALRTLEDHLKFRFLIVGEGPDVDRLIDDSGLTEVTIRTGFVDATEFSSYLGLTDILVNLRYPSMGESSGTLTRAMNLGKPAIVTRDGAFAELPDEAVYKIDVGPNEARDLATAIRTLVGDPALRTRMGKHAQKYAQDTLNASKIARQFTLAIGQDIKERAQKSLIADAICGKGAALTAGMLQSSIARALPDHLQPIF